MCALPVSSGLMRKKNPSNLPEHLYNSTDGIKKALWTRGLFQYLAPVESNCFQMNELIMLGASTNFILCSQKLTFMAITSLSKHIILDIKVFSSITEIVLLGRERWFLKNFSVVINILNSLQQFSFPYSNSLHFFS